MENLNKNNDVKNIKGFTLGVIILEINKVHKFENINDLVKYLVDSDIEVSIQGNDIRIKR